MRERLEARPYGIRGSYYAFPGIASSVMTLRVKKHSTRPVHVVRRAQVLLKSEAVLIDAEIAEHVQPLKFLLHWVLSGRCVWLQASRLPACVGMVRTRPGAWPVHLKGLTKLKSRILESIRVTGSGVNELNHDMPTLKV
jgi:hypothetical protein